MDARRDGDAERARARCSRRSSRDGLEGFNVDDEEDWERAERLVASRGGGAARGRAATVCSGVVKVASLETLFCDAGWRPWIFLKATTDDGLVGWAEITDSHGSPRGLAGIVEDLAPLVVGRDPRPVEAIYWDLYRATRQSPGSVIAKALAGIENALLDLKAKALGVPVYELFGGPTRETIPMYWSHCGTTRARAFEVTGTPKLASYDDVAALGREVVERGYGAFKTNVVVPGEEPKVLMPGFNEGGGTLRADEIADALVRLLEAFAEGTGGNARPIVDLNFNLEPEGCVRVAKALEPFDLLWLEVDLFDPAALAHVRHVAPMPICSGENLYGEPRLPPVPRGGRDGRRVGRRDLERLPPGEEDRRPRRDVRGQLRAAQLLLATSRRSSPRSGARRSRTRGSSSTTSTTCPGATSSSRRCPRSRPASCASRPGRAGASS